MKKLLTILFVICALSGCSKSITKDNPTVAHFPNKNIDVTDIELFEVDSSAVSYLGYKDGVLVIVYTTSYDRCYVYYDVPSEIYNEFIKSESIGKYLNSNIKGKYISNRIDGVQVKNGYISYIWN